MTKNNISKIFTIILIIIYSSNSYCNKTGDKVIENNTSVVSKKIRKSFDKLCEICKKIDERYVEFSTPQIKEEFEFKIDPHSSTFLLSILPNKLITYSKVLGFFTMPDGVSATKGNLYNASKIPMTTNYSIAAEGPNDTTFENFLALLAENNAPVSISLVSDAEFDGDLNDRITDSLDFTEDEYIIGEIKVDCSDMVLRKPTNVKIVDYYKNYAAYLEYELFLIDNKYHLRLYYTDWIDNSTTSLGKIVAIVLFINKIKELSIFDNNCAPAVVANCNAGVGRAGTFISIFNTIDNYLNSIPPVDLVEFIVNARKYRPSFVFNASQYGMIKHLAQNLEKYIDPILPKL